MPLFIRSFVRSCVRAFVRSFILLECVRACVYSFARRCPRSFLRSFIQLKLDINLKTFVYHCMVVVFFFQPVEVTREEFIEHYTKKRATIYPNDECFIAAVKGAWHV